MNVQNVIKLVLLDLNQTKIVNVQAHVIKHAGMDQNQIEIIYAPAAIVQKIYVGMALNEI